MTADPVDPSEPLNDAHRVPVDVIVDAVVAVLEVLAFGDAVGGNQNVDKNCKYFFKIFHFYFNYIFAIKAAISSEDITWLGSDKSIISSFFAGAGSDSKSVLAIKAAISSELIT